MQFGEHHFHFRAIPTLLLALPIPLFAALGVWQLERAEQKRTEALTLLQREQLPALHLQALQADPEALRYRAVRVQGEYEPDGQIFIENRRYGGKTGFHVITPLRQADSAVRVLVNRGWIAGNRDNALPEAEIPRGLVSVQGVAQLPLPPALVLHDGPDAGKAWGRRWPYMTLDLFAATVDYRLQPFVILQNPSDDLGADDLDYVRDWPREMPKEGMHLGYAIQWFAFALIALIIYLKLSYVGRAGQGQTP